MKRAHSSGTFSDLSDLPKSTKRRYSGVEDCFDFDFEVEFAKCEENVRSREISRTEEQDISSQIRLSITEKSETAEVRVGGNASRSPRCVDCGLTFRYKHHKEVHMSLVHRKEKPHKCAECDVRFGRIGDRNRHMRRFHNTVERYGCDLCGKWFSRHSSKTTHVAEVHSEVRAFPCDVCAAAFKRLAHKKSHMKRIHGVDM